MRSALLFVLSFFLVVGIATAQDNRTTATRMADALALLPARDASTSSIAYGEFMALDDRGLAMVIEGVRPSGDAAGVPYRYAVSLLTQSAVNMDERRRVEAALLTGLDRSKENEVKLYFIQHLGLVGSDLSVAALNRSIDDEVLADAAIGALQQIGTDRCLEALRNALAGKAERIQIRIVQALGVRRDVKAVGVVVPLAASANAELRREALWTLACLADLSSEALLIEQAAKAGYKGTSMKEMEALVQYMSVRASQGQPAMAVQTALLDNALASDQKHYRLAALKERTTMEPENAQVLLSKELDRFDDGYRRDILQLASASAGLPKNREAWLKMYKKSTGGKQVDLLTMLAMANPDERFFSANVIPLISGSRLSKSQDLRVAAIQAMSRTRRAAYADAIAEVIVRAAVSSAERTEAVRAFLQLADKPQVQALAVSVTTVPPESRVAILNLLAERRFTEQAGVVMKLTESADSRVREAAYHALAFVATPASVQELLDLLSKASSQKEVADVQLALVSIANAETASEILEATAAQRARLLPVLPYLGNAQSLQMVNASFEKGLGEEKELAFTALLNWQNGDASGTLLSLMRDPGQSAYRGKALGAFVRQVMMTDWPADQKLLKLREAFAVAATVEEKKMVMREVGGVRTFLSLIFVSHYFDDPELGPAAIRAAMRLALPTAAGQPGMTGQEVRRALEKVMEKLTGPDSQYDRIDIKNYLDQLPFTQGFESIFNGKDLSGWQGLVENPIARAKMSKDELAKKQAEADSKISNSWSVKDGMIRFTGTGDNLCTKKIYGDFELLVDWKISKNGDSGIYLRGSPQVQIWDTSRVDVGAQVGSGGLYNNTINRNPLMVADNPIGDWNTLRITMVGEKVTVYLNGHLVVDQVTMENYWDRKIPIFPSGPIELQAHGTELAFRNLYVKELNRPYTLSDEERQQGFDVLFNGRDLTSWVGNKTDYIIDDQVIAIYPTGRGKGNLYTAKEYSDFVFRFEFQLTPSGNNGLGIHAPLEGDAAYLGKEIQILDDRHPIYHDIQPWQAHGSVYGVIAAKRDALRPTGQWNEEEVEVRGDKIKVTVNGVVIVDGDMKKASAKGTLDGKEHPGLLRHKGHIGFLGHGSVVRFRNIRIKDLSK